MDNRLKDVYDGLFRVGVACETIHDGFTLNEIGNPSKEALIADQFSSMTFANELKPAYNMGVADSRATEDYLPFVINPLAKTMLDWARDHKMPVRGHVMVWHSQCAKEAFCKGYVPVTVPTDPELLKERPMLKFFEKLDPVCFVDRETMLKRLKSYIFSLMEYMFAEGYDEVIYAWDVVNEAIELNDKTPTGLRDSYWYRVIGEDFIYWAFRFAMDAAVEVSARYGRRRPRLFYNDYNEWMPDKQDAIIAMLERSTSEHGSILSEKLIDGIGMQGHLSDNNDIDLYLSSMRRYSELVDEIHVTELDVKCTCSNANASYYQAVFYKKLFEGFVKARREGVKLTCVTVWGLTDDNSWIRGADPLLFKGDLSPKKSFDALIYAVSGGSLGEPMLILRDLKTRIFGFEEDMTELPAVSADDLKPGSFDMAGYSRSLSELGFKARGGCGLFITDKFAHSGKRSLMCANRFGDWSGVNIDISDFAGQTVRISAWVRSDAERVSLVSEKGAEHVTIASVDTGDQGWVKLEGTFSSPADAHSLIIGVFAKEKDNNTFSDYCIDDLEVELVGQFESFEEDTNIVSLRGVGHLPVCYPTDKEAAVEGGRSLCVTRHEKDATVRFDISAYIGAKAHVSFFVKTGDSLVMAGLDGTVPKMLAEASQSGDWTEVQFDVELPSDLNSAQIYIETDGSADFFIDEIAVTMCK